jgi:hypothetical protein
MSTGEGRRPAGPALKLNADDVMLRDVALQSAVLDTFRRFAVAAANPTSWAQLCHLRRVMDDGSTCDG